MNFFDRAANHIARLMGQPVTFALACLIILLWGVLGPIAGYSDTWQLVINTSTTIVTFLMVFLIQNTQNRDNHALHLKIDELLRALDAADTRLVNLEERSEKELQRLHDHYVELAANSDAKAKNEGPAKANNEQLRERRDQEAHSPSPRRRNQSPRRGVQESQT
jgi:low affinity Fe/Cu permease